MRLLIVLLALLMPAPWAAAAAEAPSDTAPRPAPSHDDMVVVALSLIGTPYQFGGASPETGFDCSGLVQYILGLSSPVTLPRNSDAMYRQGAGRAVALRDLRAGDLLFFRLGQSRRVNHVAVYIGEDRFVHAPSRGGFVRVDKLDSKYWMRYFLAAKRVLPENDLVATHP
ncbi:MAG: C40 family peptidase [Pseudomonadota bacterium]